MPESIGRILAEARRSQSKTISDAADATRIRGKLLTALEADDHDSLPNPAYVRGYIIAYAKFLELEPKPLLEQYADEVGVEHAPTDLRDQETVVHGREHAQHVPWRITAIIIAVILVATVAYWALGRVFTGGEDTELAPVPPVAEETSTPDPATEPTTPGVTDPETLDEPAETETGDVAAPFTVRIVIADDGASWLEVTIDGLDAYIGTLQAGQSKEWDVTDEANILIGKPEAVTVYRDGVEVPVPSGEAPQMRLTSTDTEE